MSARNWLSEMPWSAPMSKQLDVQYSESDKKENADTSKYVLIAAHYGINRLAVVLVCCQTQAHADL